MVPTKQLIRSCLQKTFQGVMAWRQKTRMTQEFDQVFDWGCCLGWTNRSWEMITGNNCGYFVWQKKKTIEWVTVLKRKTEKEKKRSKVSRVSMIFGSFSDMSLSSSPLPPLPHHIKVLSFLLHSETGGGDQFPNGEGHLTIAFVLVQKVYGVAFFWGHEHPANHPFRITQENSARSKIQLAGRWWWAGSG